MKTSSYNPAKSARAVARKKHFSNGGTPRTWSGGNKVFVDKKKEAAKKACREKI